MSDETKRKGPRRSTLVLIALLLGIGSGIFFGEMVAFLKVVGDAYIRLLQMTVLPYIIVSLVSGLGRLTYRQARQVALSAGTMLLVMWVIGYATILLAATAYPDWQAASFFSTALVDSGGTIDFLELYIPANPFYAMANTIVPAIVVFSLALGAALIAVPEKQNLLDLMSTVGDALMRVTQMVLWLAPLGIFAITASAAGTIQTEEFGRLQVFIWLTVVVGVIIVFWTLPLMIAAFTPARYREIVRESRAAIVTAFATGSLLVVIPMMVDAVKRVVAAHSPAEELAPELAEETDAMVDVLVPTVYNFPTIGMIVTLGFIPFAAWFDGAALSPVEFSVFVASGLFSAFGGANIALPYLLNTFSLPADLYQLYLVSSVFVGRITVSIGAIHIIVLTLMSLALIYGGFRFTLKRIAIYATLVVGVTFVFVTGAGFVIDRAIDHEYTQDKALTTMHILRRPVSTRVHDVLPSPLGATDLADSRVETINRRGSIRVGYLPDRLPFAFRNVDGDIVGLDIAMAHELARDFGWTLEIVRLESSDAALDAVNAGQVDILMTGMYVTPERSGRYTLTSPHIEQTFAFVTKDNRRAEFSNLAAVQRRDDLRIAIPELPYFVRQAREFLPEAELVGVWSPREFLRGDIEADALVYTAEAGSAWSLIYPDYTVAIPQRTRIKLPMTFALPKGDTQFHALMEGWLDLKHGDDTISELFDYWILGKADEAREPRWSVVRNVLGWVE